MSFHLTFPNMVCMHCSKEPAFGAGSCQGKPPMGAAHVRMYAHFLSDAVSVWSMTDRVSVSLYTFVADHSWGALPDQLAC